MTFSIEITHMYIHWELDNPEKDIEAHLRALCCRLHLSKSSGTMLMVQLCVTMLLSLFILISLTDGSHRGRLYPLRAEGLAQSLVEPLRVPFRTILLLPRMVSCYLFIPLHCYIPSISQVVMREDQEI